MGPHRFRTSRLLAVLVGISTMAALAFTATPSLATSCPSCPFRTGPGPGPPQPGSGGPTASGRSGQAGQTGRGAQQAQQAQPAQPLIDLQPISSANGIATVSGTVSASAGTALSVGASVNANVQVSVDGAPLTVGATGQFSASIDLGGQAAVDVSATSSVTGEIDTISIPTTSLDANASVNATASLDAAGVSVLLPVDGFTVVDGVGLDVSAQVTDASVLGQLQLNGTDLLGQVGASVSGSASASGSASGSSSPDPVQSGGGASAQAGASATVSADLPGTVGSVDLTVADESGVTETATFPVQHVSSIVRVNHESSVSAYGALGIRIASIRFDTKSVARSGRMKVDVLLRDRRRYLVRDAIVMLGPAANRASLAASYAAISNRAGRAMFTVPVPKSAFGKRLYLTVKARTPRSSAKRTTSVVIH